jgi:hypothetical protein
LRLFYCFLRWNLFAGKARLAVRAAARIMAKKIGKVLEVEMGINGVNYVKFVRVYLSINLKKPLFSL